MLLITVRFMVHGIRKCKISYHFCVVGFSHIFLEHTHNYVTNPKQTRFTWCCSVKFTACGYNGYFEEGIFI